MKVKTTHKLHQDALRRIEGQVRGIHRMISEEKYCIDIIIQIHAAANALYRISDNILAKHLEHCVLNTAQGGSKKQAKQKVEEVIKVVKLLHKLA